MIQKPEDSDAVLYFTSASWLRFSSPLTATGIVRNRSSPSAARHKGRVFISEVFRFEILGFEQAEEDF
jgi:hypothetical protein